MGQQKKASGKQPAVRQYQGVRRTPKAAAGTGSPAPQPGFRAALNRASAPLLLRMHALPRWLVPVGLGLLLTLGLFLSGSWTWLGTLCLAVVGIFLLWLFLLSWPVLTPGGRLARSLAVIGVLGLAVLKAAGRL